MKVVGGSVIALLTMAGCGMFGGSTAKKGPGASDAGDAAALPAAKAAASSNKVDGGSSAGVGASSGGKLDATACNPGTSIDPMDKGKTIQSDHFKYTLLDVRIDTVDNAFAPAKKVFLVKLQVENATSKSNLSLSVTDVDLTRDKPSADRIRDKDLHYKTDFFYPRPKMCVDLGADVKPGTIPPGTKVVGYYAFQAPDTPAYKTLWFDARNVSPESVQKGTLLKVAGALRIK